MRINYNFPYYYERLSPRQRARLAAESKLQSVVIRMEGVATSILRIKTTSLSQSEPVKTKKEAELNKTE